MARFAFALDCAIKIATRQDKRCPYCGSSRTRVVQPKNPLLYLRQCDDCALLFRWPKPLAEASAAFYEDGYKEGKVTELPDVEAVTRFAREGFRGSDLDCTPHIEVVRKAVGSGRILDYGASWGYTVHQLRAAGFDAVGYELSKSRARFGREHIGVEIVEDMSALGPESVDAIHTSHVLEHVVNLREAFVEFRRVLRPQGKLVIFVPNGAGPSAQRLGAKWGQMINEVHVTALTTKFLLPALAEFGFRPSASDEEGDELCLIACLGS